MLQVELKRKPPSPEKIVDFLVKSALSGLLKVGKIGVNEHEKFVSTWQNTPISFGLENKVEAYKVTVAIVKSDQPAEQATLSVWELLDRGTDIRYMHVSVDFESKTAPRRIQSEIGAGHVTGLGFPNPGIEKRLIKQTVNEILQPLTDEAIQTAFTETADYATK